MPHVTRSTETLPPEPGYPVGVQTLGIPHTDGFCQASVRDFARGTEPATAAELDAAPDARRNGRNVAGGRRVRAFFEFADRHHPTSTYSTMTSQLTAALREHRKAPRPASWPAVAAGRGEPDDVAALWHTDAASGVAEAAALIRTWARAARRKVESTDVYRNWWRDQELHALQTVT